MSHKNRQHNGSHVFRHFPEEKRSLTFLLCIAEEIILSNFAEKCSKIYSKLRTSATRCSWCTNLTISVKRIINVVKIPTETFKLKMRKRKCNRSRTVYIVQRQVNSSSGILCTSVKMLTSHVFCLPVSFLLCCMESGPFHQHYVYPYRTSPGRRKKYI